MLNKYNRYYLKPQSQSPLTFFLTKFHPENVSKELAWIVKLLDLNLSQVHILTENH